MDFSGSDLAAECGVAEGNGIRVQHAQAGGCEILRVRIETQEAAMRIGKPQGRYVTLDFGNVCALDRREEVRVCCALAVEMREMARRICKKQPSPDLSVLVVGLGNANMTADALGPQTVRELSVTRHLQKEDRALLAGGDACELSAVSPGVPGQTGIETAELVRGTVWSVKPDLVIAIDALAARTPARLAATVQLCDSGIQPGSGVGQARRSLTAQTIGVPVMAVGVPTVIRCGTLIADALGEENGQVRGLCDEVRELCVCPKEIDLVVGRAARVLACALEKAFCT